MIGDDIACHGNGASGSPLNSRVLLIGKLPSVCVLAKLVIVYLVLIIVHQKRDSIVLHRE